MFWKFSGIDKLQFLYSMEENCQKTKYTLMYFMNLTKVLNFISNYFFPEQH